MASQMVMAIGDSGKAVRTRAKDVLVFRPVSMGPKNICTPASLWWMATEGIGGVPLKLIEVVPTGAFDGQIYPYVRFKSTPNRMYTKRDGTVVYSEEVGCSLVSDADAENPIFSELSKRDRSRLRAALH